VGGIGTGERADRVIIDDPNNPMEMESEAIRHTAIMWFTEIIPDRLNSPSDSAIVVIQQRTHEEDISGTALSREMGYEHLMIPMRYDPSRHCTTVLGWEDPRKVDEELAWKERFPPDVCDGLERDKGPYAWCNSGEAPVLMADLSMKPIAEVKKGDKIVGFEIGNREKRARLKGAEVLSISVSHRPIVRITLDSGEVIRCTDDHKWWTGRNDKSHRPYAPAQIGSTLSRVCPPRLPVIAEEDDVRLAGWLSGFFDGEGSVSLSSRRLVESNALISFTQGDGKNAPLCDKLELALNRFGFNWSFWKKPNRSKKGENHSLRAYWLKMAKEGRESRIALYQRFLHIVKPTKWRDRIIEAATTGRLYTKGERVISIKPDGQETVYGLETTTGNYVVWGLASSNSGQYQQMPAPRGGSILKNEFWQLWRDPVYPTFEYIVASLDTAMTAKDENDASALTVWGVFREDAIMTDVGTNALWMPRDGQALRGVEGNPKVMLLWAWEERLQLNELIEKVINTCVPGANPVPHPRFPVDRLLIEGKANGLSVAHELSRVFRGSGKLGIEVIDPKRYGDKWARAQSVQHLFADGMVYAPDKSWADKVIQQCAIFPRGSHDDLVDSTTQAIRYLRETGFAMKSSEYAVETEDSLMYRGQSSSKPLYGGYD
jgi:predicted phage terminase large subunit-like protein